MKFLLEPTLSEYFCSERFLKMTCLKFVIAFLQSLNLGLLTNKKQVSESIYRLLILLRAGCLINKQNERLDNTKSGDNF